MQEVNFLKLDSKIKFHYRDDLNKKLDGLGYNTISGCAHALYFVEKQSLRQVADAFDVSQTTVQFWFKKWGFVARSQGGNTKNNALKNPELIQKIIGMQGVMSSISAGKKTGVSSSTIRGIWRRAA